MAQGRWLDTGWIVTLGEFSSFFIAMPAMFGCAVESTYYDSSTGTYQRESRTNSSACSTASLGLAAFMGFRIYGIYDAIATPFKHNRRYRDLRSLERYSSNMVVMPVQMANNSLGLGFGMTF